MKEFKIKKIGIEEVKDKWYVGVKANVWLDNSHFMKRKTDRVEPRVYLRKGLYVFLINTEIQFHALRKILNDNIGREKDTQAYVISINQYLDFVKIIKILGFQNKLFLYDHLKDMVILRYSIQNIRDSMGVFIIKRLCKDVTNKFFTE